MTVDKFHIKKQEYSNRTLRFPVELLEELNTIASSKNISLNQLVGVSQSLCKPSN